MILLSLNKSKIDGMDKSLMFKISFPLKNVLSFQYIAFTIEYWANNLNKRVYLLPLFKT